MIIAGFPSLGAVLWCVTQVECLRPRAGIVPPATASAQYELKNFLALTAIMRMTVMTASASSASRTVITGPPSC
jgi:hypothetical protein